jgi:bacteriophage N4 adsorption protein B
MIESAGPSWRRTLSETDVVSSSVWGPRVLKQSLVVIDVLARETMLFAAAGLLIGGIDDALVDLCFLGWYVANIARCRPAQRAWSARPDTQGPLVVFVAAWDEVAVIGHMLAAAVQRFVHPDYRIYVGLYPNDRPTIAAAAAVAATDPRIRLVIGDLPGPTTKAGCLNTVWRALCDDERRQGFRARAVVLHDAEDVVHARELSTFDTLIDRYAVVQLPVLPLIRRGSLVSGHYADEFAYAHGVQQIVRNRLGAAMPLAGTGCAIARDMLGRLADERGGDPFDAASLTEDYEMGLRIGELQGRSAFVRLRDPVDGSLIAVRAYFPETLQAATRQKARWMTGIALAGWDRTGWARPHALGDHWMRMRDRRALLSVLVLAIAYAAILLWGASLLLHLATGRAGDAAYLAPWLAVSTTGLLGWRIVMRIVCTGRTYGGRKALRSVPRFFVGNVVALVAAPRALARYVRLLRGGTVAWDKTSHAFPDGTTLPR